MSRPALSLALLCALAQSASAAAILFDDFDHRGSDAVDWLVTVDDNTAGIFTVTVELDPSSPNVGDITGVFFDLSPALVAGDVIDLTGPSTDFEGAFDGPLTNAGSGANIGGGGTADFDMAVRYGGVGGGDFDLQSVTFSVSTLGGTLDLSDWTRVGVRSQTTGLLSGARGGSSKDVSTLPTAVPDEEGDSVPEPSGIALAAIGALWFARRRRTALPA